MKGLWMLCLCLILSVGCSVRRGSASNVHPEPPPPPGPQPIEIYASIEHDTAMAPYQQNVQSAFAHFTSWLASNPAYSTRLFFLKNTADVHGRYDSTTTVVNPTDPTAANSVNSYFTNLWSEDLGSSPAPLNVIYEALRNSQNPAPRDGASLLFYLVTLQDESVAYNVSNPALFFRERFDELSPHREMEAILLTCPGQGSLPILEQIAILGDPSSPTVNLCQGDPSQLLTDGVVDGINPM